MFVLAAHILKLEGYKENFHGPLHKDDTLICEFMQISVLNGYKVSSGKMRKFWRWMLVIVVHQCQCP